MKDRKHIFKIHALVISVIMLLSGCSGGSAGEEPQGESSSSGKVMILIPATCTAP